jgi:hypothetical protein
MRLAAFLFCFFLEDLLGGRTLRVGEPVGRHDGWLRESVGFGVCSCVW